MSINFHSKFQEGKEYPRSSIHDLFGGSRQSGISPSAKHPYIFIFSGKAGQKHGYQDGWEQDGAFSYTGHGQTGDMQFVNGNRELRDHVKNGKKVFLFEYTRKAIVNFVGELVLLRFDFFDGLDRERNLRRAIKFKLAKIEDKSYFIPKREAKLVAEPDFGYRSPRIPESTEKKTTVTTRVGHGDYRNRLFARWKYKCSVTSYSDTRILIASHIVGWKDSTDKERLDDENGLVLSPTFDSLFDKHLITFENTGKIVISNSINANRLALLGVKGDEQIIGLTKGNISYMERHRELLRKT
jgi:hypothetical protein